ncbi:MAG: RNA 2',3'-cyclic phosphodiesterase [Candidatus Omnitrophica bacterium]|nr:RNA 2',3'-cyclic phosphodiesterase [Candidatus Omnitrophota bacterium]
MNDTIRLFIAIELSSEAKKTLLNIVDTLKTSEADVKWADQGTMHLTLRFLGDMPIKSIEKLKTKIPKILLGIAPFDFELSQIGVFSSWTTPQVLWVGARDENNKLNNISEKIRQGTFFESFNKDKKAFVPHITLGRIKSSSHRVALRKIARSIVVPPVKVNVSTVTLFSSKFAPGGVLHTPLARFDLK